MSRRIDSRAIRDQQIFLLKQVREQEMEERLVTIELQGSKGNGVAEDGTDFLQLLCVSRHERHGSRQHRRHRLLPRPLRRSIMMLMVS